MGNCFSDNNAEDALSSEIDKQIKSDRVRLNNEVKLLLLGKYLFSYFLIFLF